MIIEFWYRRNTTKFYVTIYNDNDLHIEMVLVEEFLNNVKINVKF